jgi:hypothetical protein
MWFTKWERIRDPGVVYQMGEERHWVGLPNGGRIRDTGLVYQMGGG